MAQRDYITALHRQAFRLPSQKKLQPATTKSIIYSVVRWFESFVSKFQERLSYEARALECLVRFVGLVCHQYAELLRPADSRRGRRDRARRVEVERHGAGLAGHCFYAALCRRWCAAR